MLSIFDGVSEDKFVVWVKDDGTELQLLISDGLDVWQSPHPITSNDKPASRKHEADNIFLSQLKRALKKDVHDTLGTFEVDIKPSESNVQLVIKETVGTTTTKTMLFKCTLERSMDRKDSFLKIFAQASEKMRKDVLEMISLNKSIADFTTLVESLSNNTKDMTTLKEKLHDELISKFCMVLNTKKREIERLNERIDALESQYESVQNTQNTQSEMDLTQASEAAPLLKTTKTPRGRAAPKTTTMECVTGSKRKAAAVKAATRSKKKPPTRKSKNRRVLSESEDEFDESDAGVDEDENGDVSGDESSNQDGGLDQESVLSNDGVPTVTQGSVPGTQPSATNTPNTSTRGRRKVINTVNSAGCNSASSNVGSNSNSGAAAVTLSIPVADPLLLQSVAEEESEEELMLHSRPRLARGVVKESPAPKTVDTIGAHEVSHVPAKPVMLQVPPVSQHTHASGGAVAATKVGAPKSGKSKFYAEEDSEEEDNCLDYL